MRDINRISPFLDVIEDYWKKSPDLRFGQLMDGFFASLRYKGIDPFELEEEQFLEQLAKFSKAIGNK